MLGSKPKNVLSDLSNIQSNSILNADSTLSEGIYPPIFHFYRKKGIYCFRFYKFGDYKYVIVDDRLPCFKVNKGNKPNLLYGKARVNNEFWISLIEKAYAKLHTCYESLKSGLIEEG